jgi:hypothetical protein
LRHGWGEIPADTWHTIQVTPNDVFVQALDDFTAAVQNGRRAPIDATAGRRVLAIVLAMYRAAQEHCAVVPNTKEHAYAAS